MASTGQLLIVDIERTGIFPAEQLAALLGSDKPQMVDSTGDAVSLLSNPSGPRYVVVDIGVHGEDMFPMLGSVAKACGTHAHLVVVGNVNDLGFYHNLKNLGAADYFTHPASVGEVAAALQRSSDARPNLKMEATQPGKLIAFMSAASGDGASTVALNTSYAIVEETHTQTVLADFDYQFGMIARHLDLQAQYGIRELFDYPDRGVDATLVSKMLVPYRNGLNIIAAPETLSTLPQIRQEGVRELMAVLKAQFGYVTVDLPHLWTPWTAEVLAQADRIVIVGQLWLRSLTHLSRLLNAMSEAGINRNKIWLAVNRSGARFREAITPQDFERVCLKNIDFYFGNDIKTVVGAENQGKTLLEIGPSQLERQTRELARAIAGPIDKGAKRVDTEKKSGFLGRFSKS